MHSRPGHSVQSGTDGSLPSQATHLERDTAPVFSGTLCRSESYRQLRARDSVQAWALLGAQLYAIPLRVDRSLYLETSLQPGDAAETLDLGSRVQRVKRKLPSGETPPLLYQVMTEGRQRHGI